MIRTHEKNTLLGKRYRVLDCLAAGKAGLFYLAADEKAEEKLVTLRQLGTAHSEEISKEVALLSALEHPSIPRVLAQFGDADFQYVVMEPFEGATLEDLVGREGALPQERVVRCAIALCKVLEYLHSQPAPIVHRDLQPSSVFVDENTVWIGDFGLARIVASAEKKTMIGTLGYSPREQARGYPEPRSDLYAVGAIMAFCLTGRTPKPFAIPPMASANPAVHPLVAAVIDRAVRGEASARVPSANAMRAALVQALAALTGQEPEDSLERAAETTPAGHPPPAAADEGGDKARSRSLSWIWGALAALLTAAAAYLMAK
ncbi:MAG: serine/threonine protein kinase [Armatimonadetes bacterium]|nr:serine/threonine protein kinase [Armatimonadota bacterium]